MPSATGTPWFSDYDLYLSGEGTHYHAYERMGARLAEADGQRAFTSLCGHPMPAMSASSGTLTDGTRDRMLSDRAARPGYGRGLFRR